MPIARFQMPDGRIGRFEVPEGTSPEDAQAQIQQQFAQPNEADMLPDQPEPQAAAPETQPEISGDLWQKLEKQESGGRQSAVSSKGAIGVAQVMPGTAPEAAALAGLPWDETAYKTNAGYNRRLGQAYLGKQMKTFGDERLALAAYNAGPGRLQQSIDKLGNPAKGEVDWATFMDSLPGETKDYVRKIHGPSSNKEALVADVKEAGRVTASAVKGGLGLYPEMASKGLSSVSDWGSYAADKLGIPSIPGLRDLPAPTDLLREGVEYLFKPRDYEVPETEEGKAASRIGSSMIAGVTAPGGFVPNLLAGTGAGVGAEIGQEMGGAPGAVIGGIAGSLAPAGVAKGAKFLGTPVKTEEKIANMALANVDPDDLLLAQKNMEDARKMGVNLTLEQALPKQTNVRELENKLTQMRSGEPLAAQLRAQPAEIQAASERAVGSFPGQIKGQQEVANQSQQAADQALQVLRKQRTDVTRPLYEQAGDLPVDSVRKIALTLKQQAKQYPNTDIGTRLDELADNLFIQKPLLNPAGEQVGVKKVPITNINQINTILGDAKSDLGRITNTKPQADRRTSGIVSEAIGGVKTKIGQHSPAFKEAEDLYSQMSTDIVDPAKQGPLGTVAQKSGYDPSNPASRTNLYGILDRGEGVLTLQKDMAKAGAQGKQAFTDAGTSWFADKVRGAAKLEGGELAGDLAANIEKGLYGSPSQVKRTNEVLAGIARAQGVEESTFVNGLSNWAKTVASAAKRPTSTKGQSAAEIEESSKSLFGRTANISVITPFRGTARKIDEFINQNAYAHIAKLMQTPEGINTLRKLAAAKPGSLIAQNLIAKFNATMAAEQAAENEEN